MHSGSVSPMRITVDRRKCWRVYITMLNAFISRRFETRLHAVDLHTVSWSDMMLTTVVVFFLLWRVGLLTPRATSLPRPHTNTLLTSITRVLTHTWITPHLPTHPLTHTHTHRKKHAWKRTLFLLFSPSMCLPFHLLVSDSQKRSFEYKEEVWSRSSWTYWRSNCTA